MTRVLLAQLSGRVVHNDRKARGRKDREFTFCHVEFELEMGHLGGVLNSELQETILFFKQKEQSYTFSLNYFYFRLREATNQKKPSVTDHMSLLQHVELIPLSKMAAASPHSQATQFSMYCTFTFLNCNIATSQRHNRRDEVREAGL